MTRVEFKTQSLFCAFVALVLGLEGFYFFALGLLATKLQVGAASGGVALSREFISKVGCLGFFGALLLTGAVGVAFVSLGLRPWLRRLAPLALAFGVFALLRSVDPVLEFAGLPPGRWAGLGTASAVGFVGIGVLGLFVGRSAGNQPEEAVPEEPGLGEPR